MFYKKNQPYTFATESNCDIYFSHWPKNGKNSAMNNLCRSSWKNKLF